MSTRKPARSSISKKITKDSAPTPAEVRRAREYMIKNGAHARPLNLLIKQDPAETLAACRGVLLWLHVAKEPVGSAVLATARDNVLVLAMNGLEHVERQISGLWSFNSDGGAS